MTAQERMAYFQGEKRKVKNETVPVLKIKLLICGILFILFLSMDYTGKEIRGITSEDIVKAVTSDSSFDAQMWRNLLN